MSDGVNRKQSRKSRIRWRRCVLATMLAMVVGLWVRSCLVLDQVTIPLSPRTECYVESCGGVVLFWLQTYDQAAPVKFKWAVEDPHYSDSAIHRSRSYGIMMDFPWDRPHFKFKTNHMPAFPPHIPVGWRVTVIHMPYWLPAVIVSLPLLWVLGITIRRRRQVGQVRCSACGYDLRGTLAAGRTECPECGAAVGDGAKRVEPSALDG